MSEDFDPQALAVELCRVAVDGSPDRRTASVRLLAAAATLAVTEGATTKQWLTAAVATLESTQKAYKANRFAVRRVAGLNVVEAVNGEAH